METETEPPFGHLGRGRMSRTTARAIIKAHSTRMRVLLVFAYRSLLKKFTKKRCMVKPYNAHVHSYAGIIQIRLWVSDIALSALSRVHAAPRFFIFPQRLIAFLLYLTVSKSQEINRFCGKNPYIFGNPDKLFCLSDLDSGK